MRATMRHYNGVYSVFIETKEEKELVFSTKILSEANKRLNNTQEKINVLQGKGN